MRVTGVFRPSDHPDGAEDARVAALFGTLFPGNSAPAFDKDHSGLAVAALNPAMALHMAQLSRFLALETGWAQRTDLRELAIAAVNQHFRADFAWAARLGAARAAGIGPDLLTALPEWRTSALFDAEQRLVIAYAEAVMTGGVTDALFAQVRDAYGETGAIEFTTIVAFWSAWAMLINAARPVY